MNHITRPLPSHPLASGIAGQNREAQKISVGRRGFLTIAAAAGGGLMIGLAPGNTARAAVTTATVNTWVVIGSDNSITIIAPGAEMGQGINSGLAQALAEELPLVWSALKTQPAPYGVKYGRPPSGSQVTGGSRNMISWFQLMLAAGATARQLLLNAATTLYPSAPTPLKAVAGEVRDNTNALVATYGTLAPLAATLTLATPATILSKTNGYKLVGTSVQRPDIPLKVNGSAIFGLDVRVAGMVYATVKHCPVLGGTVGTMPAAPAGTLGVVNLGNAVAVVADNTWKAMQAASKLQVSWIVPSESVLAAVDTSSLSSQAQSLMSTGTPAIAETMGDMASAMAGATQTLSLTYSLPFVPHAPMEVMNCTTLITRDATSTITGCEIWVPTQAPDSVAKTAAALTGLLATQVIVHATYLGGGLGRKIEQDYVAQSIKVAMAMGKPVKLTWPREEDFARDWHRPSALSRVVAGLDAGGKITGWSNRIVAPSLTRSHTGLAPKNGVDGIAVGHAVGLPYAMQARLVEYVELPTGISIGYWRSVGESISCFVVESAIDECARAAGVDPYQYRRGLLAGNTAALGVLDAAATLGNWGAVDGHARGIAFSPGFGSLAATVVEIALTSTGTVQIVRVACAVDCGMAVNPDTVISQIEGGVVHGLSSARWGRIQYDHGISQVVNFGDFHMTRMRDMPRIDVKIVSQGSPLGGIGEVGVPAVAPALANAYAALTGTRKRSLPLGI